MNHATFRRLGVVGLIVLACTTARSAEGEGGLPAEQRAGNIAYVTGGIDLGQSAAFQQARSRYPLAIELLQRAGNRNQYTADAQVRVVDAAGNTAFEARADGPYMLVRMPSGSYRVEATLNGHTQASRIVKVGGRGSARVALIFPENLDTQPAPQPLRNGARP